MSNNKVAKVKDLQAFYSLQEKQRKAIKLMFENELKYGEIAHELKVSDTTIYNWRNREKFRQAQDEYNHFMLRDSASMALQTMKNLLSARSELVRFNAAKDILDRTGYAPVEQKEIKVDADNFVTINDDVGDHNG